MQIFKEHLMLQNFGKSLSPNHFEIGSFILYFQATARFLLGHLNGLSLVNTPSFSV